MYEVGNKTDDYMHSLTRSLFCIKFKHNTNKRRFALVANPKPGFYKVWLKLTKRAPTISDGLIFGLCV